MKIRKELLKREVGGEAFLVPLGKTVYDSNGLFVLTELGAFIWDLLPEADSADQILEKILLAYEVEEAVARADLEDFLNKLREMNIL